MRLILMEQVTFNDVICICY